LSILFPSLESTPQADFVDIKSTNYASATSTVLVSATRAAALQTIKPQSSFSTQFAKNKPNFMANVMAAAASASAATTSTSTQYQLDADGAPINNGEDYDVAGSEIADEQENEQEADSVGDGLVEADPADNAEYFLSTERPAPKRVLAASIAYVRYLGLIQPLVVRAFHLLNILWESAALIMLPASSTQSSLDPLFSISSLLPYLKFKDYLQLIGVEKDGGIICLSLVVLIVNYFLQISIGPIHLIEDQQSQNQFISKLPVAVLARLCNKDIDQMKVEELIRMIPSRRISSLQRCLDALCEFGFVHPVTFTRTTDEIVPAANASIKVPNDGDVFAGVKGLLYF
jgi:hypothetical protein